jgi:hypothetical protein
MTHPALVNPFMTLPGSAPGYPCCDDCGIRGPCDEHCPHASELVRDLRELTQSFEIEPIPAFLRRAWNDA